MFLPLPSIQPVVGVGGIRRVLIVGWPGFADFADLRRRMNGAELIDQNSNKPAAVLNQLALGDRQVKLFIDESQTWCTVTPVIIPGHDDPNRLRRKLRTVDSAGLQKHLLARLESRVLGLIWKAFHQAGWTPDSLQGAEIEYRPVGWLRGLDLARNYQLSKVSYPRYHVLVTFPREVKGPLVIGAGRYRGFGLFTHKHLS
jgi:CRISPR-associated protein Csb2